VTKQFKNIDIIIISGLSGSGKSVAIRALEDVGFFCIDNLPIGLLDSLLKIVEAGQTPIERLALVMDTRDPRLIEEGKIRFENMRRLRPNFTIVFLECSDDSLIRRFKEVRRKHPMSSDGSIISGISAERRMLAWIKSMADVEIDTTDVKVTELRKELQDRFRDTGQEPTFHLTLQSFGFKYGLPKESDLVMDVRFLPNPFYVDSLRDKNGLSQDVSDYVFQSEVTIQFFERFYELLEFLLPFFRKEGKHFLTVAVGCTGGKHRSVSMIEALAKKYEESSINVTVIHRDINKE